YDAAARLGRQKVARKTVNHDPASREIFAEGVAVNSVPNNRREVHAVEGRHNTESVTKMLLKQREQVVSTIAIDAAHAAHMAREVPVADKFGEGGLEGNRGVPIGRILCGNRCR